MPALFSVVLGVGVALGVVDSGLLMVGAALAGILLLVGVVVAVGFTMIESHPQLGGAAMEAGLVINVLLAAIGSAFVLWLAIEKAPGDDAPSREKETWVAVAGAISSYLGSVVLGENLLGVDYAKYGVQKRFAGRFSQRRDDYERDADDAVRSEHYGAMAHPGDVVQSWTWRDRRTRLRHIADAISRGY